MNFPSLSIALDKKYTHRQVPVHKSLLIGKEKIQQKKPLMLTNGKGGFRLLNRRELLVNHIP